MTLSDRLLGKKNVNGQPRIEAGPFGDKALSGYYVLDAESDAPRYLGQVQLGTNDVAGVKLFASNRNGGDAVDVVLRSLTIRADRITGRCASGHAVLSLGQ